MSLSVVPRTGLDYSPRQRFHLEKSKTRVRAGTNLEGLPGCWFPGTCLDGAKGSKIQSPELGLRRPVYQSWLWLSLDSLSQAQCHSLDSDLLRDSSSSTRWSLRFLLVGMSYAFFGIRRTFKNSYSRKSLLSTVKTGDSTTCLT